MELAAVAGCDGHHFLNGSLPHLGDNAARLRGNRSREYGSSPMPEYQVKRPWNAGRRDIGALDKAFPRPDTAGIIRSILIWSSGPVCPGPL
jgi:hypothetical protein